MLDGYGFHAGYFQTPRTIDRHRHPGSLSGYAQRAFDQGVGRSIWFARGADVRRITAATAAFPVARRADIWSGIGLAAAYAGGATADDLAALLHSAGAHRPHLGQGAAFAACAHLTAGAMPEHTDAACHVLCGSSGSDAASLATDARPPAQPDSSGTLYESWRAGIRARIGAVSC